MGRIAGLKRDLHMVGTVASVGNKLVELEINREFTNFITDNYEKLVREAVKFNIDPEYSADLINDVWTSYYQAETDGECFDMYKGNQDGIISVEQAVYGRIKGYAANTRYHRKTEGSKLDSNGKYKPKEISASSTTEEIDSLSGAQKAYSQMSAYDSLEEVEDKVALAENINYLINFGDKFGMPVVGAIEFLQKIAYDTANLDMSLFSGFRIAGKEFREAFEVVLKSAMREPEEFQVTLEKVKEDRKDILELMAVN